MDVLLFLLALFVVVVGLAMRKRWALRLFIVLSAAAVAITGSFVISNGIRPPPYAPVDETPRNELFHAYTEGVKWIAEFFTPHPEVLLSVPLAFMVMYIVESIRCRNRRLKARYGATRTNELKGNEIGFHSAWAWRHWWVLRLIIVLALCGFLMFMGFGLLLLSFKIAYCCFDSWLDAGGTDPMEAYAFGAREMHEIFTQSLAWTSAAIIWIAACCTIETLRYRRVPLAAP